MPFTSRSLRALALAALVLAGCNPCDANVCESRLVVDITEPGGGALQAGQYVIDLTVDGVMDSATCTVEPGGTTSVCSELTMASVTTPFPDTPGKPYERLTIDWQTTTPKTVKIHIEHDGVVVLDTTIEPAYAPVDETCHPGCTESSEDLVLAR